ncbi:hypothetical protein [Rudanella lutea]|nr:hypothetical protein [Rudanella lutea]
MLLLMYSLIGSILALLGLAIWRFKLTSWLSNVNNLDVKDHDGLARFAGIFLIGLGVYAVLCGYLAQQTTTQNGQIGVMILFVLGSQLAIVGYMYGLRKYTR